MRIVRLTRQIAAEFLHQRPAVLLAAMGQMQIDHGGIDVTVPEQRLHRVQTRPGFDVAKL